MDTTTFTTDAPIDDRDLYEPSPSGGYRTVRTVLDVETEGHR